METFKSVLSSGRFWFAMFALIHVVVLTVWPTFPPTIWAAIDTVVAVVVGIATGVEQTGKAKDRAILRALKAPYTQAQG